MAAEDQILELFDSFWFKHAIFSKQQPSPSPSHAQALFQDQTEQLIQETKLYCPCLPKVRSRSDHDLSITTSFLSDSFSPNSVLNTARKLQTIVSGKETCTEEEQQKEVVLVKVKEKRVSERRKLRKRGSSKSLSQLEFEELKGFMDLGFVFTDEDKKDSSLASIVPGLQRLGREKGQHDDDDKDASEKDMKKHPSFEKVSRPYLSEAWDVLERKKVENPLMRWKIPASDNDVDMKDHLKFWAHTVASTVR